MPLVGATSRSPYCWRNRPPDSDRGFGSGEARAYSAKGCARIGDAGRRAMRKRARARAPCWGGGVGEGEENRERGGLLGFWKERKWGTQIYWNLEERTNAFYFQMPPPSFVESDNIWALGECTVFRQPNFCLLALPSSPFLQHSEREAR